MVRWTLGCVPYVNARPLAEALDRSDQIEVHYAPPSELAGWIERGEVDAALVSSVHCLQTGNPAADGVCIGSDGPVQSVRLFSRVPWEEVKSLALDQSSLTSCCLARVVLDLKGIHPATEVMKPNLTEMLARHDACLIIGDAGYEASTDGLHVMDLGEEWKRQTGLPFVWAVWETREADEELARELSAAWTWAQGNWSSVVDGAARRSGWAVSDCESYLRDNVKFPLGDREKQGLGRFCELAAPFVGPLKGMPEFVAGS